MPNYSLIADAQFQPVSFQEMLYPLQAQTEYQNQIEQKYADLAIQAAKLEKLANNSTDVASYNQYTEYKNRVVDAAKNLAQHGLQGNDMSTMLNLYRDYGTQIQPLIEAQARRDQLVDLRIKNSIQNPFALYDRDPGSISLQEIMSNPSAAFKTQDGSKIIAMSEQMSKGIANELAKYGIEGSEHGYIKMMKNYGATQQDILDFVEGKANPKNKAFQYIMDTVMKASGVDKSWGADYDRALEFARMGLTGAIGKQDVDWKADKEWEFNRQVDLENLRHRLNKDLENYKAGLKSAAEGLNINPVNINTPEEITEAQKKAVEWRKNGWIDVNGALTLKGKNKYLEERQNHYAVRQQISPATGGVPRGTSFYDEINRIIGRELEFGSDGKIHFNPKDKNPQDKLRAWYTDPSSIYDTKQRTAYQWRLNETEGKKAASALRGIYGNADVNETAFNRKSDTYENKSDTFKAGTMKQVIDIEISPYGITAKVLDTAGKYHQIQLPRNLNSVVYDRIIATQKLADEMAQAGISTEEDLMIYRKALQDSYRDIAKLIGTSKAKEQEIEQ